MNGNRNSVEKGSEGPSELYFGALGVIIFLFLMTGGMYVTA